MRARALLVCLALSACGDDEAPNQFLDGGTDGAPDTAEDGSPLLPVTVVVTRWGTGIENIPVYFQNADGTLVGTVPTDVNGVASQMMAAGGYATAVDPFYLPVFKGGVRQEKVFTFADVQPGDRLVLADPDHTPSASVTLTAPADGVSDYYYVHSSGKPYTAPYQIFETPLNEELSLLPAAMYDMLVVSQSGTRYLGPMRAAPSGGVFAMTGAFADMTATTFTLTNLDDAVVSLNAQGYLASSLGVMYSTGQLSASRTPGTDGILTVMQPAVTSATLILELDVGHQANLHGFHRVVQWQPASGATFDYANTLLAPYTAEATYDVTTRVLSWTEGAGVAPEGTRVAIGGFRESENQAWQRIMIAPHGPTTSLTMPELPAPIADYNFNLATDDVGVSELTSYKAPGGWDAIRQGIFAADALGFIGLAVGATVAPSGQVLINSYDPLQPL